ncbi:hypothetical protein [Micromonospora sp. Llam0]|uniref:hypothetical protein n=1 Tax=Micromonospora sp. Llam0 TaxID=2485143 RepID=UPI0011CE5FBD|nr:hypothetical protein [Micromonospora sp. Llam0]
MNLPLHPVSDCYGYDRGTPVDRIYIDAFLAHHRTLIHGDAAEVKGLFEVERGSRLTATLA